ncbi:MAG: hypothetical protein Q4E53_13735 [Eubacteriales bacterium]|nr:hypothetical protein [Eubacteriales bacterium]
MKRHMKRRVAMLMIFTFVMGIASFAMTKNVSAAKASLVKDLHLSGKYNSYDITGDGKADAFSLLGDNWDGWGYNSMRLGVNGTSYAIPCSGYSYFYDADFDLITLKNGKKFIHIRAWSDNEDDPYQSIYQLKGGKMVNVLKLATPVKKYGFHTNTSVIKVKDNTITVKQSTQVPKFGYIEFSYSYKYKNGKFIKTSSLAKITKNMFKTDYLTVKKNVTWYASKACTKKKGTLKANTKAKAVQIYMGSKSFAIKVKTKSGKTGWIKGSTKFDSNNVIFNEVFFAG